MSDYEKRLIINADDFGLTKGFNQAITDCFLSGAITGASLCVVGEAFDEALKIYREVPGMDLGLHLVLTAERPAAARESVKTLLLPNGFFYSDVYQFAKALILKKIKAREVFIELDAQFKKALNNGIKITHVDSHQYVHLLPLVDDIVIELSEKYKVPYIRCPSNDLTIHSKTVSKSRRVQGFFLKIFSRRFLAKMKAYHFKPSPNCFGFLSAGNLSYQSMETILACLPPGISEISCHPGYPDSSSEKKYSFWKYNWQSEAELLCSDRFSDMLLAKGIALVSYGQLLEE
ncbi:MAG: ChbG/HpnK family deacetylase [Candidatus Omnitrophica bacterium]|nr:ChbG/HpnK family deacetylase [Candidatus Omnitrophota bacterium]